MAEAGQQQTLNVPSLIIFAIIIFVAVRYFFFSANPNPRQHSSANTPPSRVPLEKIETVVSMFPQMSRRDVEWDLIRNGGSVQATTERILREGRLSPAPPAFRPQPAPSSAGGGAGSTQTRRTPRDASKTTYQDLISRYNLTSRVSSTQDPNGGEGAGSSIQTAEVQKQQGAWSSSKMERQDLLRKRKEEMILAARRRMEEMDRKTSTGAN